MNAESTVFRGSRSPVVAPGAEGARMAAQVLTLPVRVAATPLGRRLVAAVVLAAALVTTVGLLYDHADDPQLAASFRPTGISKDGPVADPGRTAAAPPVKSGRTSTPAEAATAWFAARQRVAADKVRALQQRRVSGTEAQVLVIAEAGGSGMPSQFVTVRKGPGGWAVPW
jgi:hypothetical protein